MGVPESKAVALKVPQRYQKWHKVIIFLLRVAIWNFGEEWSH